MNHKLPLKEPYWNIVKQLFAKIKKITPFKKPAFIAKS